MKRTERKVYMVDMSDGCEICSSLVFDKKEDAERYANLANRGKLSFDTPDEYKEWKEQYGYLCYSVREVFVFEFDPMEFVETGKYTREQCERMLDERRKEEHVDEKADYEDDLNNINVFAYEPDDVPGFHSLEQKNFDDLVEEVCTTLGIPRSDKDKASAIICDTYSGIYDTLGEMPLDIFVKTIIDRDTILADLENLRCPTKG